MSSESTTLETDIFGTPSDPGATPPPPAVQATTIRRKRQLGRAVLPSEPVENAALVKATETLGLEVMERTSGLLSMQRANRQKNFEIASRLRNHLESVVAMLEAGTLKKVEVKVTKGSGGVTILEEVELDLAPKDMVDLSTYAKNIMAMTYEALGDAPTEGGEKSTRAEKSTKGSPEGNTLIFSLPSVLRTPRDPIETAKNKSPGGDAGDEAS